MKLSHVCNKEWGSKARKLEESQRNLTHKDAELAIDEGLNDAEYDASHFEDSLAEDGWSDEWHATMDEIKQMIAEHGAYLDEVYGDIYAGTDTTEGDF